ncbi:MAG TPA: alpha-amylase/4-alpha-glucanotransferase domain-containing protein [Thermoguttaceae bacterium]|nr:alpha-amylase/4-alpha-glucanotransferase domain-containing protein [Thermoguttaceae bacterium]
MPQPIRFVFVLHNHQPIGNFDEVFEQAYQDSYLPFLKLFGRYDSLKIALHTSGPLMEWLDANHPDYIDRLADLAHQGRIEIIGGAFYEPILAMISSRDSVGQIRSYSRWLENRLGTAVRGMWMPERVWEQSSARDLADAGIRYTVLDDFHFKNAGLTESDLYSYYLTEDDGRVISIFPGSESLRYWIPFDDPQRTIDYLAGIAGEHPDSVIVFGDDGEKFGTWPDTKKHVYGDRWLERFFDALVENQDWLHVTTLAEAHDSVRPVGKIYLPESSYREMTEWTLPTERQLEYERLSHEMESDPRWPSLKQFIRGGFWRNFKVKYVEANEMYARMMSVSRRLRRAFQDGVHGELVEQARTELYRGQCNCAYWHGAFGGIYLPHLRGAVYRHLIAADNLLDQATGRPETWIDDSNGDFNFDTHAEARLENDKLIAWIAPGTGGHLYELDVRSIRHNLLATFTRRPEAYHRKVLAGPSSDNGQCASIHERIVFKQEGLDQRIQYDPYPRKSLVDLFYDAGATLEAVASGEAEQHGDFVQGAYDAKVQRNPGEGRTRILLTREGTVRGEPLLLTKAITLNAGSSILEIAYQLDRLPSDQQLHFAVELNFAGMPSGVDDRYFYDADENRLGRLGARLDLTEVEELGLVDEWLGLDVHLKVSRPTSFWTFPVETVSQSEGGFELVHQSVVVQPHWLIVPDPDGRWRASILLTLDTALAESRADLAAVATTT